jgi:hypothetical protein
MNEIIADIQVALIAGHDVRTSNSKATIYVSNEWEYSHHYAWDRLKRRVNAKYFKSASGGALHDIKASTERFENVTEEDWQELLKLVPPEPNNDLVWVDMAGRRGREEDRKRNRETPHNIPVGALVEILPDPEYVSVVNGIRLHVVHQGRDCDETPLYWLGVAGDSRNEEGYMVRGFGGYPEHSLRMIVPPTEEILKAIEKENVDD